MVPSYGISIDFFNGLIFLKTSLLSSTFSVSCFVYLKKLGTSLVAQWLRICLPMQGTRVQALVREDPTCRRATKPMCHNYWACALEPASHNYRACVPQLLKPVHLEPVLRNKRSPCTATKSSPRSPQLEKACVRQQRTNAAKNNKWINKLI